MKIKIISNNVEQEEKRLASIVSWMVLGIFFVNASNVLISYVGDISEMVSTFNKAILFILIAFNIWIIAKRIRLRVVFVIYGIILVVIVSMIVAGTNTIYLYETLNTFSFTVFPIVIVIGCISDFSVLIDQLITIAIIAILLSMVVLILMVSSGYTSYYMGFANSLIIPVIMMLYKWKDSKKIWALFMAGAGSIAIIALGSRGALLCIIVYWLIVLLENSTSDKGRVKFFLILAIFSFLIINLETILTLINDLFTSLGITSRTLSLLSTVNNMSGREYIYNTIWVEISENPLAIRGIAGEYSVTGGVYAHNFILELLCQFGIVLGGMAVVAVFYFVIKDIIFLKRSKEKDIMVITLSAAIPLLFVSGSVWINVYFWIWLILNIRYRESSVK